MANAGWEEEDLDEISRGSCLTKLALELGLELESWVNTTTSPLSGDDSNILPLNKGGLNGNECLLYP